MHGIPRERIVVTGAPKFDEWFARTPATDTRGFRREGRARPGAPVRALRLLVAVHRSGRGRLRPALARPRFARTSAASSASWACSSVRTRRTPASGTASTLATVGNVAIWPRGGAQPDVGEARADFFDSLAHSAAVVGINTSALLEAAILGKSVLAPLAPEFAGTQLGTLHFRYLLFENGGFVHTADTLDEHADQLDDALRRGDEHADQTTRFVQSFLRPGGLDRPAAPILADAIARLASKAPEPVRGAAGTALLRVLLTPAALAAAAIGTLSARLRRPTVPAPDGA